MKTITITSPDKKTTFQIVAYKSNETIQIFPGTTGEFNSKKKSAGLIYVRKNNGISADDHHIDDDAIWEWIREWMQKGMNAEAQNLTNRNQNEKE